MDRREEATMPDLGTRLHLNMLDRYRKRKGLLSRILEAIRKEFINPPIYGLEWGDPDHVEPLRFVRDRYVLPYVNGQQIAVELGPGGGRWTRYLLGFGTVYAVDYHEELLDELKRNFKSPKMVFVRNNGTDFPGITEESVDYLFSFGTVVHLDAHLIEAYLTNMKPVLRIGANAVIQYSDKTKIMAQLNKGFSENTPQKMRAMVLAAGYRILEEDLTTLWHSSIVRFTK
jgi:phospholipid N-methyltransferase